MKFLIQWAQNHPLAYPLLLFFLGAVVSVFAGNIKRAITDWPRQKIGDIYARRTAFELERLKRLHNNAYELLLYFSSELVGAITSLWLWLIPFAVVGMLTKSEVWRSGFGGIVAGTIVSKFRDARWLISQLYDYENAVARLETEVAKAKRTKASAHSAEV